MKIRPKIRSAILVGALATVAATAWAMNESDETISSATYSSAVPSNAVYDSVVLVNEPVIVPIEEQAITPALVPVEERSVAQAGITVEERRLTEDERIQAQVMDRLANAQRISGKIGVESHDAVVTLTGYTSTAGQAYRAGREAGSVMGVKYVQNEIRPRIGGSV